MGRLLLFVAVTCFVDQDASTPSPDVPKFLNACDAARLKELERLRTVLKDRSRRLAKKELADTRRRIKELEKPKSLYLPELDRQLVAGSIGTLPSAHFKVFEVIDESNLLAEVFFIREDFEVVGAAVVARTKSAPVLVWIRKTSTADIADGEVVETSAVFQVIGMHIYDTAGGSRKKVPLLEPFDIAPAIKAFNDRNKSQP